MVLKDLSAVDEVAGKDERISQSVIIVDRK